MFTMASIGDLIKESVPFMLATGQAQPKVTLVRIIELMIMVLLSLYAANEFMQRDIDRLKQDLIAEQQKRESTSRQIMADWKEERKELRAALQKMGEKLDGAYEERRAQLDLTTIRSQINNIEDECERRIERLEAVRHSPLGLTNP